MPAIQANGGSFALDQYGFRDDSPFVAAVTDLSSTDEAVPLLLVADPVEPVPGASEVAQDILHGMAVYLRHTMDRGIQGAIINAFKTANERVYSENRTRNGMRRMYLGLSCVVLHGDELYVAQTSPSQVLVWQDGLLHAIPSLDTWSVNEISETFSDLSYPLGFHSTIHPRISYSRCAPGDVIAVVSWPIARQMASIPSLDGVERAGDFVEVVSHLKADGMSGTFHGAVLEFGPMRRVNLPDSENAYGLPLDASGWRGESRETYNRERTDDGYWRAGDILANPEYWGNSGGGGTAGFDTLGSGQSSPYGTDALPSISLDDRGGAQHSFYELSTSSEQFSPPHASVPMDVPDEGTRTIYAGGRAQHRAAKPAHRGRIVEIFAGLLLSLTAAVVGVWQVTKRDRPIHGPRDDGTLGLPHLQRWSDSYHAPRFEGIRRVSPRFQLSGLAMVAIGLAIVAVVAAVVYSQVSHRIQARAAGIEERLENVATVRGQAETMPDHEAAFALLVDADETLAEIASTTSDDELLGKIQDEERAVEQALDALTAVERLTSVQVMGSIPAAPDGVTPRLFQGDGRIFILTDGLYELDQITGSLIQLLGPGEVVGGSPVGTLLAADWSEDRPMVMDSHNAFTRDPITGQWHRMPLGILSPEGYTGIASIAAFDRNLYVLTPESGQILKFDSLDFSATPEDWNAGVSKNDLMGGVDLVVDGSIHVAVRDGRVLSFFRSALEQTVTPVAMPDIDAVTALASSSDAQFFYFVNGSDGRIVCVDRNGLVVRQYIPAAGAPSLAGATDLVIDESNGISYAIVNNTLYAVRLTLPEA